MKNTIKIDRMGRAVVPYWYRKEHDLKPGSDVEIFIYGGIICVKAFNQEELKKRRFIGMVRHLDDLNRVTIPAELFTTLGWKRKGLFYVGYTNDSYNRRILYYNAMQ